MAPFLRIAFNSYELGSLQAEDEASQPFCAVKMKEALSTGRAGGWTPETWQQLVGQRVQAQWEAMQGPDLILSEPLKHPTLPHACPPASPGVDAGWQSAPAPATCSPYRASGPSLIGSANCFYMCICARPCAGH